MAHESRLLRLFVMSVLSVSLAELWASNARAADSGESGATNSRNETVVLEEIVVTAQRREEALQTVPISAQVVSGEQLAQHNLNSLGVLSELVPSLHVEPVGRSTDIYIRGTGSGNNASFDQSVGTFLDDIYHGRSRTSAAAFLDLERVEVLKGPQSIFFGDNAIAGALNIVTRKPEDSFGGFVRALYGQYGQYALESAVNVPLGETLAVRIAGIGNGLTGWIKNVNDGSHAPDESNKAGRVSVLYRPTESLDVLWKLEASKDDQSGGLVQQLVSCPPAAPFVIGGFCKTALGLGLPVGTNNHLNAFPPTQGSELNTAESVLTLNYRIGEHTLTSVSGFYYYDYGLHVDGDGTPLTLITADVPEHYHQFSQELRIASPLGQLFEYLAGLYFHDDRLTANQQTDYFFLTPNLSGSAHFAPLAPYLPLGQEIRYTQPERTYSVFGSASWNATDQLKFTAGLRASKVIKDVDWNLFYGRATESYGGVAELPANLQGLAAGVGLGTPGLLADSRSDHALMPSGKIQYEFSSTAMAYLSYARGFKAGGFNGVDTTGVVTNLPYAPERVDAYEGGLKTTWLNDQLLFNVALFLSNYRDLQVTANTYSATGAVVSLVKNAASSRSEGVEFEGDWRVTRDLRLSVVGTYLDAYYVDYTNAGPTQLQQLQGIKIQDLSGQPTAMAPRWSENVTGAYSLPLGGGYKLTSELIGFFSSRYFLSGSGTDDPLLSQGAYGRMDARLVFEDVDNRWSLAVIGKNLTDRTILVSGSAVPTTLGSAIVHAEMARSVAVQGMYRW